MIVARVQLVERRRARPGGTTDEAERANLAAIERVARELARRVEATERATTAAADHRGNGDGPATGA